MSPSYKNGMDRDAFMRLPLFTRTAWYCREVFLESPSSESWVLWANHSIRAGERGECLAHPASAQYCHLLPQAESAALQPLQTRQPEPSIIPALLVIGAVLALMVWANYTYDKTYPSSGGGAYDVEEDAGPWQPD